MAPNASSAWPRSLASEPEQIPTGPGPDPADSPALWPGDAHRRPLDVAQCTMCGIALPLGLLVPDGGSACDDIRWYCKYARGCTERWTTARPAGRAYLSAVPSRAFAGAGEPAPAGAPAEPAGGLSRPGMA
jgi:hypothetical protein